jgi:Tetratricopeptide repeat
VLGEDHPVTLFSAHYLAYDLWEAGEHDRAREFYEDTLSRCRRVLGEDDPETLNLAHHFASHLRGSGEDEQARQLEDWIQSQLEP